MRKPNMFFELIFCFVIVENEHLYNQAYHIIYKYKNKLPYVFALHNDYNFIFEKCASFI